MREGTTTKNAVHDKLKRCPTQRAATSAQTRQKRGPIYMKISVQCTLNERPEPRQNSAQYTQKHVLAKEQFLKFEQFLK